MVAEMFNITGLHIPRSVAARQPDLPGLLDWSGEAASLGCDTRLYTRDTFPALPDCQGYHSNIGGREKYFTCQTLSPVTMFTNNVVTRPPQTEAELLDCLDPAGLRLLVRAEDELAAARHWVRVFPSSTTAALLPLLAPLQYQDRLLAAWEVRHGANIQARQQGRAVLARMCNQKIHLE